MKKSRRPYKIYNSRNLLMKFEFERYNVEGWIYNSRNLLMKFESEKGIFKPKRCNTLPIEHRLLGLKSFHKKIKTEVCIPPNVITKISTERWLLNLGMLKNYCKYTEK